MSGHRDRLVTLLLNRVTGVSCGEIYERNYTGDRRSDFAVRLIGEEVDIVLQPGTVVTIENKLGLCSRCKKNVKTRTYDEEQESHGHYYTSKTELCDSCFVDNLFRYSSSANGYRLIEK